MTLNDRWMQKTPFLMGKKGEQLLDHESLSYGNPSAS